MKKSCLLITAIGIASLSVGARSADKFELQLPVDCDMKKVCSIHKFMDHDPGPERRDYACGRLSLDGDTGADFRVANLAIMKKGIPVIAAADGVVRARRDGMDDISVRNIDRATIKGRDAGNAVVLSHEEGWETQYSHLKKGTVRVKPGDEVKAGDILGEIGLSGNTEFPHVEFSVRHQGNPVDPFVGLREDNAEPYQCNMLRKPLWSQTALQAIPYRATGILNAGFISEGANIEKARAGEYDQTEITTDSPALVLWADVFGSQAGDIQEILITLPDGHTFINHKRKLKKNNIAWFAYAGKKRPGEGWQKGTYQGTYRLLRRDKIVAQFTKSFEIE